MIIARTNQNKMFAEKINNSLFVLFVTLQNYSEPESFRFETKENLISCIIDCYYDEPGFILVNNNLNNL